MYLLEDLLLVVPGLLQFLVKVFGRNFFVNDLLLLGEGITKGIEKILVLLGDSSLPNVNRKVLLLVSKALKARSWILLFFLLWLFLGLLNF